MALRDYLEEQGVSIFGWKFGGKDDDRRDQYSDKKPTQIIAPEDDGALTVETGGVFGTYVDLEGTARSEVELLSRYRELALQAEADDAIQDIVDEAIVKEDDKDTVSVVVEKIPYTSQVKKAITSAFEDVLTLLNFKQDASELFKRWYIDGRLYYHIIIDEENPHEGIQELRYVDPRKIKKVREIIKDYDERGNEIIKDIEEYFVFNPKGLIYGQQTTQGIKITTDAVMYTHSGILDSGKNIVLSHLQKAIKPMNQLRMTEDALVIYRMSRAPERRVFYIDVGGLPKNRAEAHMKNLMQNFRNKSTYDSSTGEIRNDKRFNSMMEDFWLPRREGQKTTEIETLRGAENLGVMEDVEYFRRKLYEALKVPVSRTEQSTGFNMGRESEITRDEVKFTKYVNELRGRFSILFDELLKKELMLRGIIREEDWDVIKGNIHYRWLRDSHFSELKNAELWKARSEQLVLLTPYVGANGFFSKEFIWKNVLHFTDEEIQEQLQKMEEERKREDSKLNPWEPGYAYDRQESLAKFEVKFEKDMEKMQMAHAKDMLKQTQRHDKSLAKLQMNHEKEQTAKETIAKTVAEKKKKKA